MGFKKAFPSLHTDIDFMFHYISSSYRDWGDFRNSTLGAWRFFNPVFESVVARASDSKELSPEDAEELGRIFSTGHNRESLLNSMRDRFMDFVKHYHKDGKDYLGILGLGDKEEGEAPLRYYLRIVDSIISEMDVSHFVPVAYYISKPKDGGIHEGKLMFPSFYFLGVYTHDLSGSTNFVARISSHPRPRHNAGKGEIDFQLGNFYEFGTGTAADFKTPASPSLSVSLKDFSTYLGVLAASYQHKSSGETPSSRLKKDYYSTYPSLVVALDKTMKQITRLHMNAMNFTSFCVNLTSMVTTVVRTGNIPKWLAPPTQEATSPWDYSKCGVRWVPDEGAWKQNLIKGWDATWFGYVSLFTKNTDAVAASDAYLLVSKLVFDKSPGASSLLSLLQSSYRQYLVAIGNIMNSVYSHKSFLSTVSGHPEGLFDDPTQKHLEIYRTIKAFTETFLVLDDYIPAMNRTLQDAYQIMSSTLNSQGNVSAAISAGLSVPQTWWDAHVNVPVTTYGMFKGVTLATPPADIQAKVQAALSESTY
jgi:hypothetical protein